MDAVIGLSQGATGFPCCGHPNRSTGAAIKFLLSKHRQSEL